MDGDRMPDVSGDRPDRDPAAIDRARRCRKTLGLSLRALARAVGVSHETIRQWEAGRMPRRYHHDHYMTWIKVYGGKTP